MVIARPEALIAAPATGTVVHALVPDERFESFRTFNGIDPRTLRELAYAEHGRGDGRDGAPAATVLVVRGPFNARVAVAEMAHRMMPLESQAEDPIPRCAGFYGEVRRDALAVDPHTLVVVTGPPMLTQRVLDETLPRALEGDGGALLAAIDAPLVAIWPRPLELPEDSDLSLLLARQRALAVAFADAPDDVDHATIAVTAEARGEFPPGIEDNLRVLVGSLAASPMGRHLGMAELDATLHVALTAHGVRASGALAATTLARGLRDLLVAELPEIFADTSERDRTIGPGAERRAARSEEPSTAPRSAP